MLLGEAGEERLWRARVAVFGLGGVGGHVVEALARSGVGALDLVDKDTVSITNLNRQLLALHSTLGMPKVDVAEARVRDISPECTVRKHLLFYTRETAGQLDFAAFDYVVDALDTVTAKLCLVEQTTAANVPLISCMGAGNRLDPGQLRVADLAETRNCRLARIMRKELRRRGIEHLKVVYSPETAIEPPPEERLLAQAEDHGERRSVPGSTAFVPAVAGLLIAAEVVRTLTEGIR